MCFLLSITIIKNKGVPVSIYKGGVKGVAPKAQMKTKFSRTMGSPC